MIEPIGTEIEDTEDTQHWRQRRMRSRKSAVHDHHHRYLRICQEFCASWFFVGICFAGAGITCMVVVAQNLKLDICNWIIWTAYIFSTLSVIIGIAVMGRALAKLMGVIIKECQQVYEFESLPTESPTEYCNPRPFVDDPQSSSGTPRAPEVQPRQITVVADVHRSQDSSDSAENYSLCNFAEGDRSSVDESPNSHSVTQEEPGTSNSLKEGANNGKMTGSPELEG